MAPDAERLAVLLDGRLGGTERESVLAEIAASDEALTVAESAAVLRELEERKRAFKQRSGIGPDGYFGSGG